MEPPPDALPPEPAPTADAGPPDPKEGFLEIARAPRYSTTEATFQRQFYEHKDNVNKVEIWDLFDHRTNSVSRKIALTHYLGMCYELGGLLLARVPDIEHELDMFVKKILADAADLQVWHAKLKLASLIDRLGFGVPQKVPEGEWNLTEDQVFRAIEPRIIALHESEEWRKVLKK